MIYGKFSKFMNTSFFLFSNEMLAIKAGIHKTFVIIANREDPDLGLHYLSRPFFVSQLVF